MLHYKKISIVFLFVLFPAIFFAQVSSHHLLPLLSSSYQGKYKKAEATIEKGKALEDEAIKIRNSGSTDKESAKNEKKYNIKRLEASQYYQKANFDLADLLKENIERFWKSNKEKSVESSLKNREDNANELLRKAKSLRKVAADLTYPGDKLVKILEAEENENEAINIFTKVLYAYLNYPEDYDKIKTTGTNHQEIDSAQENIPVSISSDSSFLVSKKQEQHKDSLLLRKLPESKTDVKKDTTPIPIKPVVARHDSSIVLQEVSVIAKKDTLVHPKALPFVKEKEQTDQKKTGNETLAQPLPKIIAEKDTGSLYGVMEINEDQIDKFNKFLQTSYPKDYENYIIDFQSLDYSNVDSLKSAWYKYMYAGRQEDLTDPNVASVLKDSLIVAESNTKYKKGTTDTESAIAKNKTNKKGRKLPTQVKQNEAVDNNLEVPATGFIFKVQIAACRIPIDPKSLSDIYNGKLEILELKEENWHKYAIGEFNTYRQARKLRDQLKVPGAFVIAYLNGKRIKILSSMTSQSPGRNIISKGDSTNLSFKVQIAASKIPLGKKYIENIYSGSLQIERIHEDEWFKYVISFGPDFNKAKDFIEKEDIPGAFIISYQGNKRIELKEAIKLSK